MSFLITTDTSCDLPKNELEKLGVPYIPLTYTIDDKTYVDDFTQDVQYENFYKLIKSGAMPTTSQINSFLHEKFFCELFNKGHREILHLSISSGLSTTYNCAVLGAECAMEKHPGLVVKVIDTLSATQAHRALLDKALDLRKENLDLQLTASTLDGLKNNLQAYVFVDNLMHLKRGGRISGAAAHVGTLLKIKPVLTIDSLGKLTVINKANGIKKAMTYGIEMLLKNINDIKNSTIYLANTDANDKIEELISMLRQRGYQGKIVTGWIGPVIGSHTGAGTFGLVFFGNTRIQNKG